ncbi:MAG: hypothetical protein U0Y82_17055, partial [Thermoleophilia bacterium]
VGRVELPGPTAVQRPLEVLDAMGPHDAPALIWSTVTDTVLVVGRAGRDPILNRGVLEARGIPVVNRRSGGGPVLWDRGLLGLDVLVPRAHRLAPADVTLAYRWLGTAVAEALTRLGVPAHSIDVATARAAQRRDDEEARLARVACFGGFSPFEVVGADGRKLVGLAQVRRRTGTLFQCGIAMDMDVQTLAQVLSSDPQAAARRATALDAITTGVHGTAPGLTTESVMREVEAVLMSRDDIRIG